MSTLFHSNHPAPHPDQFSFSSNVIPVKPRHHVVSIFRSAFGGNSLKFGKRNIQASQLAKSRDAGPGFGRSAANGIYHQPNRDVDILLHAARKVVSDSGNLCRRLGGDSIPCAVTRSAWMVGRMFGHSEEADLGIIRSLHFIGAVQRTAQLEFHIGLAAAEPHIAHQNIVKLDTLTASDFDRVWAAGRRRLNFYLPAVIGAGNSRCRAAPNRHLDPVARLGPAPDLVQLIALQYHVVAKDRADKWKRRGCRHCGGCWA